MAKNLFFSILLITILLAGLVAACAQPAPAPAPAPAPVPAPAPAPAPTPTLNWNVQCHQIAHDVLPMPQLDAFTQRVTERTNGKLKIHSAVEGELGIHRDTYNEALASGVLEIAAISSPTVERVVPSAGIHHLPQMAVDAEGWIKVWEALADFDQAAFKKVGYQLVAPGSYYIEWNQEMYSSEAIPDLTDLSGYKVRVWQTTMEKVVEALGGEPVYMAFSEVFMAMQRGVVDAYMTGPPAAAGGSAWDVANQFYPVAHPGGMEWLVISTKALETLPDDYKTVLIEEASVWGEDCRKGVASEVESALSTLEEHGMTMNDLSSAERDAWREAAMTVWAEWAAADPSNAEAIELAKKAMGL